MPSTITEALTIIELPAQNVNNAQVEKPYPSIQERPNSQNNKYLLICTKKDHELEEREAY